MKATRLCQLRKHFKDLQKEEAASMRQPLSFYNIAALLGSDKFNIGLSIE